MGVSKMVMSREARLECLLLVKERVARSAIPSLVTQSTSKRVMMMVMTIRPILTQMCPSLYKVSAALLGVMFTCSYIRFALLTLAKNTLQGLMVRINAR